MRGFPQGLGRHLRRAMRAERFVRHIVVGGIALVAGLWVASASPPESPGWLVGAVIALGGLAGLIAGIWRPLSLQRP